MTDSPISSSAEAHRATADVHLVLRRGGLVPFMLRHDTGSGDGRWHLPAGPARAGESVIAAAVRVARTELGIDIELPDMLFSHVMHDGSADGRIAFFFTLRAWRGDPAIRRPDTCAELAWFSARGLPERLADDCRIALRRIGDARPFSSYGWEH